MQRKAIIYRPAKNAMQSGTGNTHNWVLEFVPVDHKKIDPIMGWISSSDTTRQLRLYFETAEAAMDYAKENNIAVELKKPHQRHITPKSYASNFSYNKRQFSDIASSFSIKAAGE